MKKGISAVVATVLTVLITVAAVTIIWVGILPMIKDEFVSSSEGRVSVISEGGYTVYDSVTKQILIQVKQTGGEFLERVKLVLEFDGNSISQIVDAPGPGMTKTYDFSLVGMGVPVSVKVVPIFKDGNSFVEGVSSSMIDVPIGDIINPPAGSPVFGAEVICDDADGDGYGVSCGPGSDCDDGDALVWVLGDYYVDVDGDGYGEAPLIAGVCSNGTAPDGHSSFGTDCDDAVDTINPGVVEDCGDGIDNDCDGYVDGVPDATCEDWDDSTEDYMCGGSCNFIDIIDQVNWFYCAGNSVYSTCLGPGGICGGPDINHNGIVEAGITDPDWYIWYEEFGRTDCAPVVGNDFCNYADVNRDGEITTVNRDDFILSANDGRICRKEMDPAAVCGDGVVELYGNEECDESDFGVYDGTCDDYNPIYVSGDLGCVGCQIDSSGCQVLPAELMAEWLFDGDANDNVNSYHGVLAGTIEGDEFITDADRGQVLDLDGNEYVSLAGVLSTGFPGQVGSFSAWINLDNPQDSLSNAIFYVGAGPADKFNFSKDATNQIKMSYKVGGVEKLLFVTDLTGFDSWRNLIMVWDYREKLRLYDNGKLVDSIDIVGLEFPSSSVTRTIGSVSTAEYFNGRMDDVRLYRYLLGQAEVENLYCTQAGLTVCSEYTHDSSCDNDICGLGGCGWNVGMGQCEAL